MTAKLIKSYIRPSFYKSVIYLEVSKRAIDIQRLSKYLCCFYTKERKEEIGKEMKMERKKRRKEKNIYKRRT
jgi:hypothetical protein